MRPRYLIGIVLLATLRRLLAPGDAADLFQPSLKVVYMTGYAERAVAGELAPWPLLQKPFDVGALADTIREVLDDDASAGSADPLPSTQP